jgi:hypothetical protein
LHPDRSRLIVAAALVFGPAAIVIACSDDDAAPVTTADASVDSVAPAADVTQASTDAGADVVTCVPRSATGRTKLSETGLFADIATKTVACDVMPFEPEFKLWSDAAEKKRWVRLPPGATIDTTDPDHWIFPVGTQFFKEFALDGKRLETRLVERIGNTGQVFDDYWLGAFLWRDDESDADFVEPGASNVRGTPHDVPSATMCLTCHIGEPGRALGFSALQLSHDGFFDQLRAKGFLGTLEPKPLPGSPTERAGVGWLHANCGHCHNINGSAWPDTNMTLRIAYGEADLAHTKMYLSTVGVSTQKFFGAGITKRVAPGDPDASCVAYRPSVRGDSQQMPPIATEFADDAGVASVRAWISSLDAGAP